MTSKLAIEEMETLRRLALEITSELDRDKLLHTIIRSAGELLRASGGGIYEYDRDEELLRVVADWGRSTIIGHTLKVGQGLAGRVLEKREAMAVDDYRTWPGRSPHLEPGLVRAVAADLLEAPGGHIVGVLYVTDNAEGRTFSEREISLLGLLAGHAAIAMRNAEVLAEKQLSLTQLELINKFDESIREALNLKELLQKTLKEALRAVKADEGSVMILDHEEGVLKMCAWIVQGEYMEKEHPVFKLGQGIAGHVAATGREHYCPDTSKDEHYQASFTGRPIQSILSVPIISRGLVLGVVSADSETLNAFNDHDLQMLKTLASHVAQAIEAQRFRDVAISLSTLAEEEMYKSIVKNACILAGTEVSTIFLRDGDAVTRRAVFTLIPLSEGGSVRDHGITQRILATGRPEIINNAQTHPDVKPSMKHRGTRSVMGVPLSVRVGDGGDSSIATIGVLFVSSTQSREFGERDREILQSLASQAAIAITKARLIDEARRESDSARWLNSQLLTLYSITEEMQSEQDLSRLLNLISEKAAKLLGGDAGGILLEDSEGGRLCFKGSYGLSDEFLAAILNADRGTLVADYVVESRTPMIVNDLEGDQRFVSPDSRAENIKAVISTPLFIKNKIIGTLDIHSKTRPEAFDEKALRILSLLANQAALAIENTRVTHFQQSLLTSAFDAIIAVNDAGFVREFNDSAQKILGYTRAEAVDGKMEVARLFYRPEDAENVAARLEDAANGGRIPDIKTLARNKSGEPIPILLSACKLESGSVGFFRDERAIESAFQYIQQLKDMLQAVQAITELTDVRSVLTTTVEKTVEMLKADTVSLYLYDQDADSIQLPPARAGEGSRQEDLDSYEGPDSIPRRLIRHGEIHYAEDAPQDWLVGGDYVQRERILSCVACPLKSGKKVVGVLFCNYKSRHHFTDREKAIIDLFTSEVAIALENARLFNESTQANERLQALYKASLGLAAGLPTEDILQTIVDSARTSTRAQYTALGILTPDWKLNPFVVSGLDGDEAALISHPPVGKGVLGVLLKQGQVINVPDVTAHSDYAGNIPDDHPRITSFLGVPIVSRDRGVIGDLYAANKEGASAFTPDDEANLQWLAFQAGIMMERAATQETARAEQAVNISFLLLSRWALAVTQGKSALEVGIKRIERSLDTGNAALIPQILGEMSETLHEIGGPQQSLQLELQDKNTESVNLSQLIVKVASRPEVGHRIQSAPELDIRHVCMVTGNELLLEFALSILINNAVEAIELKGGRGELKVSCVPDGKIIQVHISDTGAGIPQEVLGKLYRVPLHGGEGTGYGSLAAGMILKVHGGDIYIVSTGDDGTDINFWLPAAAQ